MGRPTYEKCKNCDYTETNVLLKTKDHDYGEWKITKESTVESVGKKERICSVCNDIEEVDIPKLEYNPDDWIIDEEGTLTWVSKNITGDIIIPSIVESIGTGVFDGNKKITSVTMSSSISTIGKNAFSGCTNLATVNLSSNIESIDTGAFAYCTSLTSIIISDSLKFIGEFAFNDCENLSTIYYEGTAENWKLLINNPNGNLVQTNHVYIASCSNGILQITETINGPEIQ